MPDSTLMKNLNLADSLLRSQREQSLENWQRDFFQALTLASPFTSRVKPIAQLTPEKSFFIYQRAYFARLMEALGSNYPATWWLLGDADYLRLARKYVHSHPSENFDLSDFGAQFSAFLRAEGAHESTPFICDVADFELLFRRVFHAPSVMTGFNEQAASPASTSSSAASIRLAEKLQQIESNADHVVKFQSSVQLFQSDFAVYEIWQRREQDIASLQTVDWQVGESLLLYNEDQRVHVMPLNAVEFAVCEALIREQNISRALECVAAGDAPVATHALSGWAADEITSDASFEITPEQIHSLFVKIGPLLI